MVIANEQEIYKEILTVLEQRAEVHEAKGFQDALSKMTVLSYHLILIFNTTGAGVYLSAYEYNS